MKVTVLRIWVMLILDGKEHCWYWDKRYENYVGTLLFNDDFILECVRKHLKLNVSGMIDEVDNFGNPKHDSEEFEEFVERKYSLKLNPEKMSKSDVSKVLLAMYGIKTKPLNPKKVIWELLQDNATQQVAIDPKKYDFPDEMLDYLSKETNLFKSITGGVEGPTMIELRLASNLKLIDVQFWAEDENIRITNSFFNNDPNKGNDKKMYKFQAIDLIRENDLYQSEGLLIWVPQLKKFGTYDPEHQNLVIFPEAKAKDIQGNFGKYIAAQWSYGPDYLVKCGNIYDYFEPWKYFSFE